MKIAQIQFTPWDKVYNFTLNNLTLVEGDKVIVKTELGTEIGRVVGFKEANDDGIIISKKVNEDGEALTEEEKIIVKPILRKATATDLEKVSSQEENEKALNYCKSIIGKYKLPMKLVNVHFSFDGSRVTFTFISDGRVDFRELVKELTRYFNRTIRLQQIGIRDEAKLMGDYGHCGRQLCCKKFLGDLSSITSEMAEEQQVVHRGSDRISGICGRLMCCLAFEQEGYKELAQKLPPLGSKVNVDGKKGTVVGHHILRQAVNVEFPGENGGNKTIVEVDLNRKKD